MVRGRVEPATVVVVGTAILALYPLDLVRGPANTVAAVGKKKAAPGARRSLQPNRPSAYGGVATPWGVEVKGLTKDLPTIKHLAVTLKNCRVRVTSMASSSRTTLTAGYSS